MLFYKPVWCAVLLTGAAQLPLLAQSNMQSNMPHHPQPLARTEVAIPEVQLPTVAKYAKPTQPKPTQPKPAPPRKVVHKYTYKKVVKRNYAPHIAATTHKPTLTKPASKVTPQLAATNLAPRQPTPTINPQVVRTGSSNGSSTATTKYLATTTTGTKKSVPATTNGVFSDKQRIEANTAANVPYMTPEEKKVILLINLARMDGNAFLKEYADYYITRVLFFQNNKYAQTLYQDLRRVKGLPPLTPSKALAASSRAHAQDIGSKGMRGHTSSSGLSYDKRIGKFVGMDFTALGENISYGTDHNLALPIVLNLLIDNNNDNYGHRRNLLSPSYEQVGISIQQHRQYGFTCVQDFGAGVGE